jgi:hypothetical protein
MWRLTRAIDWRDGSSCVDPAGRRKKHKAEAQQLFSSERPPLRNVQYTPLSQHIRGGQQSTSIPSQLFKYCISSAWQTQTLWTTPRRRKRRYQPNLDQRATHRSRTTISLHRPKRSSPVRHHQQFPGGGSWNARSYVISTRESLPHVRRRSGRV